MRGMSAPRMTPRRPRQALARALSRVSLACLVLLLWQGSSAAHAEGNANTLSNPRSAASTLSRPRRGVSASSSARSASASASASTATDEGEPEEPATDPMSPVGIGVHLGVAGTQSGSGTIQGFEGRTDRRVGLHLSVPIYLGGSGFGWVFEPMLQRSEVEHFTKDVRGNITGTADVGVLGLGGYTGPQVQIQATRAFYVGLGLGPKVLYLVNDAFDYALDLYGRVPLSGTYYVNDSVAVTVELGLCYGVTVFADRVAPVVTTETNQYFVRNANDDPEFGAAFAWDFSVGVRLP